MDSYIQIKRKLGPQNAKSGNMAKLNRVACKQLTVENKSRKNWFAIREDKSNVLPDTDTKSEKRKPKPPPIFIRTKTYWDW